MDDLALEMLEEISCERGDKQSKYLDNLLEAIYELAPYDNTSKIEKKFHCNIGMSVEKHNTLQFTHYYTITSDLIDGELNLEIESGINNGTLLRNYSFEGAIEPGKRFVEILKDVVLDEKAYVGTKLSVKKARAVFPHHKDEILRLYKNQNYDDYVTGGGTNKTDAYYEDRFDKFKRIGLFWKCIYEEIEVDLNLI